MLVYFTPVAADLVILTIDARKVASAEEYIANTIGSAYYRFFPMMNKDGTDIEIRIASTHAKFSMKPVGTTIARTNVAGS